MIREKNIERSLDYLEKLDDKKYEKLADSFLEEQAFLSTFIQQNLDNIFDDNNQIKDFTYNLYFTILFILKSKLKNRYKIIDKQDIDKILQSDNFKHNEEELGDFIYTQFIDSDFSKNDFLKIIGLLNIVIKVNQ